jgi:hypothetical protein
MLINEVVVKESYFSDLIVATQDLLVRIAATDVKEIPTEKFKNLLAKAGFIATTSEVIQAVDQSGFANSVDKEKIVPIDELPDTVSTEVEPSVDVGAMAGNQAMQDINAELPQ